MAPLWRVVVGAAPVRCSRCGAAIPAGAPVARHAVAHGVVAHPACVGLPDAPTPAAPRRTGRRPTTWVPRVRRRDERGARRRPGGRVARGVPTGAHRRVGAGRGLLSDGRRSGHRPERAGRTKRGAHA